jgi:acylphosphatase
MTHSIKETDSFLTFQLTGQLQSEDFSVWMTKQAAKLGVDFELLSSTPNQIDVSATGTSVMLEAFALACSLGPKSVYVESLEMGELSYD